jgi:predicted Holliday junction resolvase-like endonuclease
VKLLNVYVHFQIQMLENKLASIEKELQQVKKDNAALTWYINARRKKEEARRKKEARKKAEEEVRRKAMVMAPTSDEGQSSKDVRTWSK